MKISIHYLVPWLYSIFLKHPILVSFDLFQTFFQNLSSQTEDAVYLREELISTGVYSIQILQWTDLCVFY